MVNVVEACGTAIKIIAAAVALAVMLLALTVGTTAAGIVGLAANLRD